MEKVYVVTEEVSREGFETTIEIMGVYSNYRVAAEMLIRRNYMPTPIYIFRKPVKEYLEYKKRDGLYDYESDIQEFGIEEY